MNRLGILFTSFCLLPCLVSCQKEKLEPINPGKGILNFSLLKSDNPSLSEDVVCAISEDGIITGTFPELLEDYHLISRFEYDCEYVTSSSRLQISGTTVQDFSKPVVYEAKMMDGTFRKYTVKMSFPVKPSLPFIKIETKNGAQILDKKNYINGKITISDPDALYWDVPELVLEMTENGIRGRGNTTWDMPKKPYKIKLDKKVSIFNLPADKEWVLLANYSDKTLLRNVVAMKLSKIVGMKWTPAMLPVEVYLNNDYLGCYTFSEHKKVAMLVASSNGDRDVEFDAGVKVVRRVPYYSGFYGSYGWKGYYDSFLRSGDIAYVGIHRHDSRKRNEIMEYTYMCYVEVPVAAGCEKLILPDDRFVSIFAATAIKD